MSNDDSESAIIELDISYENSITALKEAGIHDAANLTVFEYEQTYQYFKNKKPPKHS
jgi:hypothetical protein